jgi:hypothetical protein
MLRQKTVWSVVFVVAAVVLMATTSAQADVVSGSLLYLDAANADGAGHLGSGLTWTNLASTGSTYNGSLYVNQGYNGTLPVWAGSGTVADPYTLQFRASGTNSRDTGFVAINNSYTTGNALDIQTYTYETWEKIVGPGGGPDGALGVFIAHNTNASGQGNGSIAYNGTTSGNVPGLVTNGLWTQGGSNNGMALPNSSGVAALSGYHHVVLARAGGGATDTAWYLDGVLQGTFQTDSGPSVDSYLTIGARGWGSLEGANFLDGPNADIAIVRVYGSALTGGDVLQNYNADVGRFVPEPGTFALLITGFLGLLAYAWRKRK